MIFEEFDKKDMIAPLSITSFIFSLQLILAPVSEYLYSRMFRALIIVAGIGVSGSACTQEGLDNKHTGTQDTLYDAWISFSDKGVRNEQQLKKQLSSLEQTYPARALARRQKRETFPGLFDERDLPLYLKYLLPKHFILYKPRDIVSGDFYWLTQGKEIHVCTI